MHLIYGVQRYFPLEIFRTNLFKEAEYFVDYHDRNICAFNEETDFRLVVFFEETCNKKRALEVWKNLARDMRTLLLKYATIQVSFIALTNRGLAAHNHAFVSMMDQIKEESPCWEVYIWQSVRVLPLASRLDRFNMISQNLLRHVLA